MLEKSFRTHWERAALSNYQGVTLKYGDVAKRIAQLHILFRACGLKEGDKVALCSKNQANWGVCFLAAMTYGAVPVPSLHEFKAENVVYLVNHSDARVLFIDEANWEGTCGSMKLAVPTSMALAPAIRNSSASSAVRMPPSPTTGIFTA